MLHHRLKSLVLGTVSVSALLVAGPGLALAQDDGIFTIEEIMVTARRRSESLSDVPGTVTAFTASTLESAGVQRAADFIRMTPGVTMVDAAEIGDSQVNIRGINGARDAENSFAYIVDGVLYTNPAAFNREYTDLQQIEIFKGPQGAIYGRNAAAGAIIVTTAAPDEEFSVHGTASFAEDSTHLIKGSVSGQLSDGIYGRLSVDWRKSDGHYRNSFQGDAPTVDAYEGYNINGRLIWEGEALKLDTKIRYGRVDASSITFNSTFNLPVFAELTGTPTAFQDVNDFDFLFQANAVSDNDQESFEMSTKFDYELDGMTLTGWVLYSDIQNDLMSDGTSGGFGFYAGDPACIASTTALGGTPLLGPQFIGATSTPVLFDFAGSFLGAYTPTTCDGLQEQVRNQSDFSAEIRLASSGDGALQWMTGLYYLDISREVGVSLNRDSGETPIRGLFQNTGPNITASLAHDQFDSRVLAIFGQVQYDVTDALELSVALRYDSEKRQAHSLVDASFRQNVIDLNFDNILNDPLNPALSSLINTTGTIPDSEETFEEFQPKISATFDATDDLTFFASWGVGFKAGGFNNSGSAATVNIFINSLINGLVLPYADNMGVPLPVISDNFRKETSSAFELGFKSKLMDGRVQFDGALYRTTVDDMQFFEFFVGSFGLLRVVSNLDKVEILGGELSATVHVNENLRFYGGASFIESDIKANSSRPDTVGNKAPYTPDYTFNFGADFDLPISEGIDIVGRVDGQVVGPTWFHTVQEGQRPTIFMPLFQIGVFGPVFGDASPLGISDFSNARRDAYTTIDLRFGLRGEGWSLIAFATNVTNEKYLEEVIPAPEFGGSFDHPGSQRRFGAELGFRF